MEGIGIPAAPFSPAQPYEQSHPLSLSGAGAAPAPSRAAGAAAPQHPQASGLPYTTEGTVPATVSELNNAPENLTRMRVRYPGDQPPAEVDIPGMSDRQEIAMGLKPVDPANPTGECQTCKQRKYQDGSDDPGVSFKTPTRIDPDRAASAVRGHEQEHVVRERAEARREGRKVVSQSVSIHMAICPECGRVYVSGGVTRTTTASDNEPEPAELPGSGEESEA